MFLAASSGELFAEVIEKRGDGQGEADPGGEGPAALGVAPSGEGGTDGTASEEGGHVEAVEAAAMLGGEDEEGALAEDEIGGHAEVENDCGHDQRAQGERGAGVSDVGDEKSGGNGSHGDSGCRPGPTPVGDASGDWGGDSTGDSGEGEPGDSGLGELEVRPGEQEWRGGPEKTEGTEEAGVIERTALENGGFPGEMKHRSEELSVVHAGFRYTWGQDQAQGDGQGEHERAGNPEDGLPRGEFGDEAGSGTGQHDATHESAHDGTDHATARFGRGEMRRVGDEDLHGNGTDANEKRGDIEWRGVLRAGGNGE